MVERAGGRDLDAPAGGRRPLGEGTHTFFARAYDSAGKELSQVWGRIKVSSLKPGASEALVLVMRLSRLPDGIKATTLEELGGT